MRIDPGDGSWWEPKDAAAVVVGGRAGTGDVSATCCTFMNFFASPESARRYLRDKSECEGEVISIRPTPRAT